MWLEFRSSERTGSGQVTQFFLFDIRAARNIDDDDFWPGITEQELERMMQERGEHRATEMLNVLILAENGTFWKEQLDQHQGQFAKLGGARRGMPKPWELELDHRDELISTLESRIEEKYLRYCDPSNPAQLLAMLHIRGSMAYMRLMSHHPRRWAGQDVVPPEQLQFLWKLCMQVFDIDSLQRTTPSLQKFAWRFSEYFHWQALVFVMQELRKQPLGPLADQGFQKIHEAFRIHPSFVADKHPLHVALCTLALKAWDARRAALQTEEERPPYIETLLRRREAAAAAAVAKKTNGAATAMHMTNAHADIKDHSASVAPPAPANVHDAEPYAHMPAQQDFAPLVPRMEQLDYPFMDGGGELQDATFMDWDMWDNLIKDFEQGDSATYA
jgi:hypothetical protein